MTMISEHERVDLPVDAVNDAATAELALFSAGERHLNLHARVPYAAFGHGGATAVDLDVDAIVSVEPEHADRRFAIAIAFAPAYGPTISPFRGRLAIDGDERSAQLAVEGAFEADHRDAAVAEAAVRLLLRRLHERAAERQLATH